MPSETALAATHPDIGRRCRLLFVAGRFCAGDRTDNASLPLPATHAIEAAMVRIAHVVTRSSHCMCRSVFNRTSSSIVRSADSRRRSGA